MSKRYTVVVVETVRRVTHVDAATKTEARRIVLTSMIPAGVMKRRIEGVYEEDR